MGSEFVVTSLRAGVGHRTVVDGIDLTIPSNEVVAIIGPSGCGKSMFVRCLNRMHERTKDAWVTGQVTLDGQSVYHRDVDPAVLRRTVGMVFPAPNPFRNMSIRANVLAGLRLSRRLSTVMAEEVTERVLKQVSLWQDVRERLNDGVDGLSDGQQQRLCIARALAMDPAVLLMDDPCATLDPIATAQIENVVAQLREQCTVVLVTHSVQQAARVSDSTAFFQSGKLIEHGLTGQVFTSPADQRTEDYLTGRVG